MEQLNENGESHPPSHHSAIMSNNGNIFDASNNNPNSSFQLLQHVQSILQENNDAKAKTVELENQVAILQKEREDLDHQLVDYQDSSQETIEVLKQNLSEKEEEWTEKFQTASRESKDFENRLWAQQAESDIAHQEKIEELESQIISMQNDLESQRAVQREEQQVGRDQVHGFQQTIQKLQTSSEEKDTTLQTLNETVDKLRNESMQLKQDHQSQVQDMKAKIANLEEENVAQQKEAEDCETESGKQLYGFQQTIQKLQTSSEEKDTTLQTLKETVDKLRNESMQLKQDHQSQVQDMKAKIANLEEENVAQQKEAEDCETESGKQLYGFRQTIQKLQTSSEEKDTTLQTLKETIDELRNESMQLKQDHQPQVQDMKAKIANLEEENLAQQKEIENHEVESESLQKEIDSLKAAFLQEQKQVEESETEKKQRNHDMQEQDSKWQDLVQSLRIEVQAQANILETQGQDLEDAKSQNMQLRVQLQVTCQQKEEMERNWAVIKTDLENLKGQLLDNRAGNEDEKDQEETAQGGVSEDDAVKRNEVIAKLEDENRLLNDRIVQMEAEHVLSGLGGSQAHDLWSESKEGGVNNTNDTIEQLQMRIMHLVDEKLVLQTTLETLEYQYMEADLLERNAVSRKLQEASRRLREKKSPATAVKEYWRNNQHLLQQEIAPIVVDKNMKQSDIIRLTMERKQAQKLSRRITNKVLGPSTIKSKPAAQINIKAAEKLFLQRQLAKKEKEEKHSMTLSSTVRSSTAETDRTNLVHNRDHGLSSQAKSASDNVSIDNPESVGSNQGQKGTVQSAVKSSSTSSKNEKTTTWTRIRDTIAGSKDEKCKLEEESKDEDERNSEESKDDEECKLAEESKGDDKSEKEPWDVDADFSLWVQELQNQEQKSTEGEELQQEIESLSVPASMLDMNMTLPGARYGVKSMEDFVKLGHDGNVELRNNKITKQEAIHPKRTYTVATPDALTEKKKKAADIMGRGREIDQPNLLGVFVDKQKEATTATTLGYLSSIIYGDPLEEEIKAQERLLRRHLAQKRNEERQQQAQLKKEAGSAAIIADKSKTVFSSFI